MTTTLKDQIEQLGQVRRTLEASLRQEFPGSGVELYLDHVGHGARVFAGTEEAATKAARWLIDAGHRGQITETGRDEDGPFVHVSFEEAAPRSPEARS